MEIKLASLGGIMLTVVFQTLTLRLHNRRFRRISLFSWFFDLHIPMVTHQIAP